MTFDIDDAFPLVTLVSMLAPSPDWFVGVSGLSLRDNGEWISTLVVDLHVYDAGTDSGPTYTSPNQNTVPAEPITEITGLPFSTGGPVPPLGTFTLTRISFCAEDIDESGVVNVFDLLAVLDAWGASGGPEDVNGDGTVNVFDLLAVLDAWGEC